MVVQSRANIDTSPFVLSGIPFSRNNEVFLQDGGRATPLAQFTLLSQDAITGKWEVFDSLVVVETGASVPRGIYLGDDIPAADIVAGDIAQLSVLVGGAGVTYDDSQLVIENALLLTSIIKASTAVDNVIVGQVKDFLEGKGLFAESTVDIAEFENA